MTHKAALRMRTKTLIEAAGILPAMRVAISRYVPTTDEALPFVLIYTPRETMGADGDARSGVPAFVSTVTLSIVARVRVASEDLLDAALDALEAAIYAATIKNPAWWGDDVEGVESIDVDTEAGETDGIVGQVSMRMSVLYRVDFPPDVDDDLDVVAVSRAGGGGAFIDNLKGE